MTPHFGAGVVQAIDVRLLSPTIPLRGPSHDTQGRFILGRLIAHPLTSLSRVQDALRVYEEIRFPFACAVAGYSLSTGWMHTFMTLGYYDGTRRGGDLETDSGFHGRLKECAAGMEEVESKLKALVD